MEKAGETVDYERIIHNKNIWIYGYSNLGRNAYNRLLKLYPNQVRGILVSKFNKRSKEKVEIFQRNIHEIGSVKFEENTIIIIATNKKFHHYIIESIKRYGNVDVYIYDKNFDNWLLENIEKVPLLETKFMALSVGQACNFKCKDCANFAPYAKPENMRYSIENIKKDIEKVFSYFSEIDTVHIQGGEPFLYTELAELLYFINNNYKEKIHNIQIATNGTLKPSQEVIDILKKDIYSIRISNYELNKEVSESVKETIEVLNRNGIKYRKYDFAGRKGNWSHTGEINYVAPIEENLYEKVINCDWNACYTIENGIVGRCARSIPARTLQKIQIKENDYLELTKDISIEKVGRYFMFIDPMECCRHCKGSQGEVIRAAVQIK